MTVETATYINQLDATYPAAGDSKNEGDDHLRLIKSTVKATFANVTGAVTPTHTELNYVDGVTSAIQTQLDAKAPTASPTFTGTPAAPTASAGTATTQLATTAFVATAVATQVAVAFSATTTATSKTLAAFEHVVVTASGQTMTLPASPTAGTTVCRISTRAGVTTTVGRNGNNIMNLAENMTIPYGGVTVTLAYHNSTDGWVIQ